MSNSIPNQSARNDEQANLNQLVEPSVIDSASQISAQKGPQQGHWNQSSRLHEVCFTVGAEILIGKDFGKIDDGKQNGGRPGKLCFGQFLGQHINLKWGSARMRDEACESCHASPEVAF